MTEKVDERRNTNTTIMWQPRQLAYNWRGEIERFTLKNTLDYRTKMLYTLYFSCFVFGVQVCIFWCYWLHWWKICQFWCIHVKVVNIVVIKHKTTMTHTASAADVSQLVHHQQQWHHHQGSTPSAGPPSPDSPVHLSPTIQQQLWLPSQQTPSRWLSHYRQVNMY